MVVGTLTNRQVYLCREYLCTTQSLPMKQHPKTESRPIHISTHDPARPLAAEQELDLKKGVLTCQPNLSAPKRKLKPPKLPPTVPAIAHSQGLLRRPGFAPRPILIRPTPYRAPMIREEKK